MIYPWQFYIFLGYGIPLFLLYIFVLIQLIFNKEFKAPFFKIATILGFVDLITFLSMWVFMKLPICTLTGAWFPNSKFPFILKLSVFLCYCFPKIRELLVLASAFNRFTALALPHKHKEIWSKWLYPIIIFSCSFPFLTTFQNLTGVLHVYPFYLDRQVDSYVLDVEVKWYPFENSMITSIHTFITASLSFICNMSTLHNLYVRNQLRKKQVLGTMVTVTNKAETNLFIISLWDFLLDLIYTAHQAIMFSFSIRDDCYNSTFDTIFLMAPWIFDLVTLSRPCLFILMCKQMQVAFIIAFKKGKLLSSFTAGGSSVTTTTSHRNNGK